MRLLLTVAEIVPSESCFPGMISVKTTVIPSLPVLATSAHPCNSVAEASDVCMNQLCPGAIAPEMLPLELLANGIGSDCPSCPQNCIVKLTGTDSRLTNAKLVFHPAPSAICGICWIGGGGGCAGVTT